MNTKKAASLAVSIALVLIFVGVALAQAPSGPPKPGPEHQKLAYFAGKWSSEGDVKPGPFGPGGKVTFTETCEWFDGNFALVCHSDGKMQDLPHKGLSVMGWAGTLPRRPILISRPTPWARLSFLAAPSKATPGPGTTKAK